MSYNLKLRDTHGLKLCMQLVGMNTNIIDMDQILAVGLLKFGVVLITGCL